jgi:hypothetical protein
MEMLRQRATMVWVGLMAATVVTTWGLSKDSFSPVVTVVGTFVIAALKVRYVILDFMELRGAPRGVRIAFEAWPVAVTAIVLVFWFLSR